MLVSVLVLVSAKGPEGPGRLTDTKYKSITHYPIPIRRPRRRLGAEGKSITINPLLITYYPIQYQFPLPIINIKYPMPNANTKQSAAPAGVWEPRVNPLQQTHYPLPITQYKSISHYPLPIQISNTVSTAALHDDGDENAAGYGVCGRPSRGAGCQYERREHRVGSFPP